MTEQQATQVALDSIRKRSESLVTRMKEKHDIETASPEWERLWGLFFLVHDLADHGIKLPIDNKLIAKRLDEMKDKLYAA